MSRPLAIDRARALTSVSCLSDGVCIAVDATGRALNYNGTRWSTTRISGRALRSVSCARATNTACLAVAAGGRIFRFASGVWRRVARLGGDISAVSCALPNDCFAIDSGSGRAVHRWNGRAWRVAIAPLHTRSAAERLAAISCVRVGPASTRRTHCEVLTGRGNASWFDGSTWHRPVHLAEGIPSSVSCTGSGNCVLVTSYSEVVTFRRSSLPSDVTEGDFDPMSGVSCIGRFCVAVDVRGGFVRSTSSFDGSDWARAQVTDLHDGMAVVSCVSARFCAAGDVGRHMFTFNGTRWSARRLAGVVDSPMHVLSCVSRTFCLVMDEQGHRFTFGGTHWVPSGRSTIEPAALSCESAIECVSVGLFGSAAKDARGWAGVPIDDGHGDSSFAQLSCARTRSCVAMTSDGDTAIWSGDPHDGYAGWNTSGPISGARRVSPTGLSCAPRGAAGYRCVAVDGSGNAWSVGNGVHPWTRTRVSRRMLTAIDCPSATVCVAVDASGHAYRYANRSWSRPRSIDAESLVSVSCPTTRFCTAVDSAGRVVTYS